MPNRFNWVEIRVKDLEKAKNFYGSLFFQLKCPMCGTHFQLASMNRLKLSLERVAEESERFLPQRVVNKEEHKT